MTIPSWLNLEHVWLPYTQMKTASLPFPVTSAKGVRLKLADDFGRAVSRPIVHNEDFSVRSWKILLQDADDCFFDKALVVVRVN